MVGDTGGISKACGHIWCVVLCLSLGYLTVFGGRGYGNMKNKTFPKVVCI